MLVFITVSVLPRMSAVELLDDRKMMELNVKMRKGIRRSV